MCANPDTEPVINCFTDFPMALVGNLKGLGRHVTCYEVGKLALNLLPILLSRIETLGRFKSHEVTVFLRSHPPFHLLENDRLELEKTKAAQAIQEFLKVRC